MSDMDVTTLSLIWPLLMFAGVFAWMAHAGSAGTLPRNGAVGIRTRTTKSSDEAWYAAHRAAASMMRAAAVASAAALALAVACLVLPVPEAVPMAVAIVGFVIALALLLAGWMRAQRAAKATQQPPD